MEHLENYYNEKFKSKGFPDFKDLTNEEKITIANLVDFAFYKSALAVKEFNEQINKAFCGLKQFNKELDKNALHPKEAKETSLPATTSKVPTPNHK